MWAANKQSKRTSCRSYYAVVYRYQKKSSVKRHNQIQGGSYRQTILLLTSVQSTLATPQLLTAPATGQVSRQPPSPARGSASWLRYGASKPFQKSVRNIKTGWWTPRPHLRYSISAVELEDAVLIWHSQRNLLSRIQVRISTEFFFFFHQNHPQPIQPSRKPVDASWLLCSGQAYSQPSKPHTNTTKPTIWHDPVRLITCNAGSANKAAQNGHTQTTQLWQSSRGARCFYVGAQNWFTGRRLDESIWAGTTWSTVLPQSGTQGVK